MLRQRKNEERINLSHEGKAEFETTSNVEIVSYDLLMILDLLLTCSPKF
jgi:hypothetical protein